RVDPHDGAGAIRDDDRIRGGVERRALQATQFVGPPALGDVLKRARETNRPAVTALGGALAAHPNLPSPRRDEGKFQIERRASVDGRLDGTADDWSGFWPIEVDRL